MILSFVRWWFEKLHFLSVKGPFGNFKPHNTTNKLWIERNFKSAYDKSSFQHAFYNFLIIFYGKIGFFRCRSTYIEAKWFHSLSICWNRNFMLIFISRYYQVLLFSFLTACSRFILSKRWCHRNNELNIISLPNLYVYAFVCVCVSDWFNIWLFIFELAFLRKLLKESIYSAKNIINITLPHCTCACGHASLRLKRIHLMFGDAASYTLNSIRAFTIHVFHVWFALHSSHYNERIATPSVCHHYITYFIAHTTSLATINSLCLFLSHFFL